MKRNYYDWLHVMANRRTRAKWESRLGGEGTCLTCADPLRLQPLCSVSPSRRLQVEFCCWKAEQVPKLSSLIEFVFLFFILLKPSAKESERNLFQCISDAHREPISGSALTYKPCRELRRSNEET